VQGEKVIEEAHVHWIIFIAPILLILIGLAVFFSNHGVGFAIFFMGLLWLAKAALEKLNTELVLTNKRVISKFGILRRVTMDMNLMKVEGVSFRQGIAERIFGYGSIFIRGTGGDNQPIPHISNPMKFKNAVNNAIDGKDAKTDNEALNRVQQSSTI
jgi:uncharacterized membrane protein YdbT with pleckstrin-like domain